MTRGSLPSLAFLGGTGAEGSGLALRFAQAGYRVAIGSRAPERAETTARSINERLNVSLASGHDNLGAVASADAVFVTVPYGGQAQTLASLAEAIGDKLVVSTVVPLAFKGGRPSAVPVPAGSAAQEAQQILPRARVTAAFHHVSAKHLAEIEHPLEGDILVCGDDPEALDTTSRLVAALPDLRSVVVGGLETAAGVECFTVAILSINRRHRIVAGIKVTGL